MEYNNGGAAEEGVGFFMSLIRDSCCCSHSLYIIGLKMQWVLYTSFSLICLCSESDVACNRASEPLTQLAPFATNFIKK